MERANGQTSTSSDVCGFKQLLPRTGTDFNLQWHFSDCPLPTGSCRGILIGVQPEGGGVLQYYTIHFCHCFGLQPSVRMSLLENLTNVKMTNTIVQGNQNHPGTARSCTIQLGGCSLPPCIVNNVEVPPEKKCWYRLCWEFLLPVAPHEKEFYWVGLTWISKDQYN